MGKKIGILTSGGDSPGMNAAVVSVARCAAKYGIDLVGIQRGYNGIVNIKEDYNKNTVRLGLETALDIADQRGTFLRTARCKEFMDPKVREKAANDLREVGIEALVVIGGDGSYHGAQSLCEHGIPCVGIPGTIDNDLGYTEATLGYDTAVNVCVEAVRSIRATSRSHDRPAIVQVMGRDSGAIAMRTAIATGAEFVIVPEVKWNLEAVAARLNALIKAGNTRATIIITEHCTDDDRMDPFNWQAYLNANGKKVYDDEPFNVDRLASVLKFMCGGAEVRATVIGYTQRGAQPSAYDSAFAFEAGHLAVELLKDGTKDIAQAIGIKFGRVYSMPFLDALEVKKDFKQQRVMYDLINSL